MDSTSDPSGGQVRPRTLEWNESIPDLPGPRVHARSELNSGVDTGKKIYTAQNAPVKELSLSFKNESRDHSSSLNHELGLNEYKLSLVSSKKNMQKINSISEASELDLNEGVAHASLLPSDTRNATKLAFNVKQELINQNIPSEKIMNDAVNYSMIQTTHKPCVSFLDKQNVVYEKLVEDSIDHLMATQNKPMDNLLELENQEESSRKVMDTNIKSSLSLVEQEKTMNMPSNTTKLDPIKTFFIREMTENAKLKICEFSNVKGLEYNFLSDTINRGTPRPSNNFEEQMVSKIYKSLKTNEEICETTYVNCIVLGQSSRKILEKKVAPISTTTTNLKNISFFQENLDTISEELQDYRSSDESSKTLEESKKSCLSRKSIYCSQDGSVSKESSKYQNFFHKDQSSPKFEQELNKNCGTCQVAIEETAQLAPQSCTTKEILVPDLYHITDNSLFPNSKQNFHPRTDEKLSSHDRQEQIIETALCCEQGQNFNNNYSLYSLDNGLLNKKNIEVERTMEIGPGSASSNLEDRLRESAEQFIQTSSMASLAQGTRLQHLCFSTINKHTNLSINDRDEYTELFSHKSHMYSNAFSTRMICQKIWAEDQRFKFFNGIESIKKARKNKNGLKNRKKELLLNYSKSQGTKFTNWKIKKNIFIFCVRGIFQMFWNFKMAEVIAIISIVLVPIQILLLTFTFLHSEPKPWSEYFTQNIEGLYSLDNLYAVSLRFHIVVCPIVLVGSIIQTVLGLARRGETVWHSFFGWITIVFSIVAIASSYGLLIGMRGDLHNFINFSILCGYALISLSMGMFHLKKVQRDIQLHQDNMIRFTGCWFMYVMYRVGLLIWGYWGASIAEGFTFALIEGAVRLFRRAGCPNKIVQTEKDIPI